MGFGLLQLGTFPFSPLDLLLINQYAVIFSWTVPLMIKTLAVKTAFIFVGLGIRESLYLLLTTWTNLC